MLSRFLSQHRVMREIIVTMRPFLAAETPGNLDLLAENRAKFDALLADHVSSQAKAVAGLLAHDPRASMVNLSRRLSEDLDGWMERYRTHRQHWSVDLVKSKWPDFRRETIVLLDALLERLEWEEHELYPAFLQIATTAARMDPLRH